MLEEKAALEHFRFFYLSLRKDGKLLGCMYFQLLALQQDYYPDFSSVSRSAAGLFKYFQGREFRLLVSGHLFFNHRKAVYFVPDLNENDLSKIYEHCLKEVVRFSGADIFMAKEPEEKFKKFLEAHPKRFLSAGPDYLMNLFIRDEWNDLDDYASDLRKKYAQRFRKIREQSEKWTFRDFSLEQMDEWQHPIFQSYLHVIKEAEFKLGKLNYSFFRLLKSRYQDKFIFRAWIYEGEFKGFSTLLVEAESMELYYIGLPEDLKLKQELYPVMMLNGIESAIKGRHKILRLGRTALEAKAMFGAEAEELTHYVSFQNRWLRYPALSLLKYAATMMGSSWKERKPFRNIADQPPINHQST